jgi:threonine synthase
VFLATAHPAKFRETVEPVIGEEVPLPPSMRDAAARPEQVTELPADYDRLKAYLSA